MSATRSSKVLILASDMWGSSLAEAVPFSSAQVHAIAREIALGVCPPTDDDLSGHGASARLEDFVAGGLYRATVKVKMWRVAAADVPTDPDARVAFLHAEWRKVNAWVAQHQRVAQ